MNWYASYSHDLVVLVKVCSGIKLTDKVTHCLSEFSLHRPDKPVHRDSRLCQRERCDRAERLQCWWREHHRSAKRTVAPAAGASHCTDNAVNRLPALAPEHTYTHPFNGPFSGTTQLSRYQKGTTNLDFTGARDSEWQWHQLGHMQVCTLLQIDNHTSTPPLCFLQAGCPSCHPTNSIKALKAIPSTSASLIISCTRQSI